MGNILILFAVILVGKTNIYNKTKLLHNIETMYEPGSNLSHPSTYSVE